MTANDSMIVAVNWISRIFVHLNEFCHPSHIGGYVDGLSPGFFMGSVIPLETTYKLRCWFVDLWNARLANELRNIYDRNQTKALIKREDGCVGSESSANESVEDPVKFVVRTWPWKEDAKTLGLPQALIPIFSNNVGLINTRSDNNSNTTCQHEFSINTFDNKNGNKYQPAVPQPEMNKSNGAISGTNVGSHLNNKDEDDPLVSTHC